MPVAVIVVAAATSLAVAYAQLLSRPDDLALSCAAFTAMYLMVHYGYGALTTDDDDDGSSPSPSSSDGDDEAGRAHGKRVALVMALVLYGLACAEVWHLAASREIAVAALASWCGAAVLLLAYLVVARTRCAEGCYSAVATDVP